MIDGVRVDARDQIEPTFRVPAVRIESGYMVPTGVEPAFGTTHRGSGRDRPWHAHMTQKELAVRSGVR